MEGRGEAEGSLILQENKFHDILLKMKQKKT